MSGLTLDLWGEDPTPQQAELPLDLSPALPEPPARKERGHLTDLQLFDSEPEATEETPNGSPELSQQRAFWRLWKGLYQIDSKLARSYRGATAPDHKALARLVNDILFGVESDKPELTLARTPRIERAHSFLARYLACKRTQSRWECAGLGDLP